MRRGQFRRVAVGAALLLVGGCGSVISGTAERYGGAVTAATSVAGPSPTSPADSVTTPAGQGRSSSPVTSSAGQGGSSSVVPPSTGASVGSGDQDGIAPQTVTWMTHTCSDLLSVDDIMGTLPVADPADPVTYRSTWSVYYSGLATAAGLAIDDMDSVAPPAIPNGATVANGLVGYLGQMQSTAQQASQLVAASSLDGVDGTVAAESAAMAAVNPADYGLAALDQGQLKQLQDRIPACQQFLQSGGG